jgi:hypothetical protein
MLTVGSCFVQFIWLPQVSRPGMIPGPGGGRYKTGERPMAEFFAGISKIKYEGPKSKNPLSFKHYNADELIAGKKMADHFRFSVAYWHAFCNGGADQFGVATRQMPWVAGDAMQTARNKVQACFEFCEKLGARFYCFHDRDVAPEGATLAESNKNFREIAKLMKAEQDRTGIKPLWGTACLFAHPRFMHGAATSCNADVFAYAAASRAVCRIACSSFDIFSCHPIHLFLSLNGHLLKFIFLANLSCEQCKNSKHSGTPFKWIK